MVGKFLIVALAALVWFFGCISASFAAPQISTNPVTIDKRIKNIIYNESSVYELKFWVGYQSIIEFAKNETIETIAVGDPYPWKITPIDRRLFIKPSEPGVITNMTVITSKRIYYFEISSDYASDKPTDNVVYVARFFYPIISLDKEKYSYEQFKQSILEEAKSGDNTDFVPGKPPIGTNGEVDPGKPVNFNYSFEGDQVQFTPLEVFDDTKNTYIRFVDTSNIPAIYAINQKGKKSRTSISVTDEYVVVRGVHYALMLEQDGKSNTLYNESYQDK